MLVKIVGALLLVLLAAALARSKKAIGRAQIQLIKDMEATLEAFASEMQEENEKLLHRFKESEHRADQMVQQMQKRIDFLEKHVQDLNRFAIKQAVEPQAEPNQTEEPKTNESNRHANPQQTKIRLLPQVKSPDSIKDRYNELFAMHDQGKTSEEISKILGLNKGEVQLIIQLARQEKQLGN